MRAAASALLVAAVVVVAGCGGGGKKSSQGGTDGRLPACAHAGTSVVSGLPASFPLPGGTVVRSSKKQQISGRSFRIVSALSPGTIESALVYMRGLPKAGYRITDSDSEESEAEAEFVGHGVQGRLRFRSLPDCPGALTFDIGTTPR